MNTKMVESFSKSQIPVQRAVAYCKLHDVYLNAGQLKNKSCLKKKCQHLKTIKHPYWSYLKNIKEKENKNDNN